MLSVLNVHTQTEDKCGDTKDSFYEGLERAFAQFVPQERFFRIFQCKGEEGRYFRTDSWEEDYTRN
jgi:hypothetical protein